MKNIVFIFLFCLISSLSIAQQLEGIYVFKTIEEKENHYLVFDNQDGNSITLYYGSENGSGHGIFYYTVELRNLKLDEKGIIEFEIGARQLFETSQFKIVKHESHRDKPVGSSKSVLKYKGQINGNQIKLTCSSEFADCWQEEMIFEKVE